MHAGIRLTGACLVMAGATAWGQVLAQAYAQRCRELAALEVAVGVMETEIGCGLLPIAQVFERAGAIAGSTVGHAFADAACQAHSSADPGRALTAALRHVRLRLTDDDLAIVDLLAAYLGMVDRREQIRHIRAARERLRVQTAHAREQRKKYERLFRYLGPLAGVAVVVLLI